MILGCGRQGKTSSQKLCFPDYTCLDSTIPIHTISTTFLYTLGSVLKSCARSNRWDYTLKLMREPVAELGTDMGMLWSPSRIAPLLRGPGELVLGAFNIRHVLSPGLLSRTHVLKHPLHLGCSCFL